VSIPHRSPYRSKRLLDLSLIFVTAPLTVPLLLTLAAMVRLKMGSPVLFRQERAGQGARPFMLVKFRTMCDRVGSDGRQLPDAQRLPPFGRWLRSTSLDELPELLNILRGEMSLVGPRPLLMRYVQRYSPAQRRRLEFRPGLTGLAQVSGRNALPWPERFAIDVEYVNRASLALDLQIILRTCVAVFLRRGISAEGEATMGEFFGSEHS
jgi:sugar transferase EpsL